MTTDAFAPLSLSGKVAIVTGAASGIGRATALLMAGRGAAVAFADIDVEGAEAAAAAARSAGGQGTAVRVDVTDEAAVQRMAEEVSAALGGIDILHNNAALLTEHQADVHITDLKPADFARILEVNLIGYMTCAKHCLPRMIARGGGVIVNTASLAGVQSSLSRPMYGASKAGVIGLTRTIATQYGKQGVRCVAVSPGMIPTEQSASRIPQRTVDGVKRHSLLSRVGNTNDVAQLVAFLASDAASYLTGINVIVDGGMSAHLATYADELDARSA